MKSAFSDEPFGLITTELGELAIYPKCLRDDSRIEEDLKKDITKVEAYEYFKIMLKYISHKSDFQPEDKSKLYEPTLNSEDIDKLSQKSLNSIADLILKNNEYLYKELIRSEKTNEEGIKSVNYKLGKIRYKRKKNEDKVEYIFRLECIQYDEMKKQMDTIYKDISDTSPYSNELLERFKATSDLAKQLTEPMRRQLLNANKNLADSSPFSKSIQDQINSTRDLGKQLSDSYKHLLESQSISPLIQFPNTYNNSTKEMLDLKMFKSPFNNLQKEIQILIEYIRKSNDTQTSIATEIKSSSGSSTIFSKKNIGISVIIVILSLFTIGSSIYFSILASSQSQISSTQIITELKNINHSITAEKEKTQKYFYDTDQLKQELKTFESEIKKKNDIIDKMSLNINNLSDSIATLKSKTDTQIENKKKWYRN